MTSRKSVKVLVLRRDPNELDAKLTGGIADVFRGRTVEFVRVDPRDHLEMDALCCEHDAAAVILPSERPIPATAMERGVPFVDLRDGKVVKLKPLVPEFEPFYVFDSTTRRR